MAMTVGQDANAPEEEVIAAINTTPLVDVMLVLLAAARATGVTPWR